MARPLQPMPNNGEKVVITTQDCEVDWIMLEVTQGDTVRYTSPVEVNDDTEICLPSGVYRFNFHYQNSSAPAAFSSSVKTPARDEPYPTNPANGSGSAQTGEAGLTAYRVEV